MLLCCATALFLTAMKWNKIIVKAHVMFITKPQSYKSFFIIYMIFLLIIIEDNIFNNEIFIKEYQLTKEDEWIILCPRGLIYSSQIVFKLFQAII